MIGDENIVEEPPFVLTEHERTSPLWAKIQGELEKKLAILRVRNDDPTLTESETAALRGQIKSYKTIIKLGEEPRELV
jgi:hypothetical protein